MLCPFLKKINYYKDRYCNYHEEKNKAVIQKEVFCDCEGSECMAYDKDAFGKPYCKLIEKKN